jgi:hypothetical protein
MNAVRAWEDLTGRPPRIAGKSTAGATAEMTHRPYRGRRLSWQEFFERHPERRAARQAANDNGEVEEAA